MKMEPPTADQDWLERLRSKCLVIPRLPLNPNLPAPVKGEILAGWASLDQPGVIRPIIDTGTALHYLNDMTISRHLICI